jgi:hypothetical protein
VNIWDDNIELVLGDQQTVKAGTLNGIITRLTSDVQYGKASGGERFLHANLQHNNNNTRYEVFIDIYCYLPVVHYSLESA